MAKQHMLILLGSGSVAMSKASVLIVEDEFIFAKWIRRTLADMGYRIQAVVNSGEKAVEEIERGVPDVILMDIRLKGAMDGIETAEHIRNRLRIPIIFLTGYADRQKLDRAKLTLPFGYLLKPVQDRELRVTIEMALYLSKADAERRQAEQALRESEERYRMTLEASPDPIAIYDSKGRVYYLNPSFERTFGWTRQELKGRTIDFIPEGYCSEAQESMEEAAGEQNGMLRETRRYTRDRRLLDIQLSSSVFCDNNLQPIGSIHIYRDVTEIKCLEAQLRHSQKMEAMGTMAGGIAHDFNNILSSIIGFTEIALYQELPKNSPASESLEQVLNACSRVKNIIKLLLSFSRKTELDKVAFDINILVKETLKMLRASLPATIEIRCSFFEVSSVIRGSPDMFQQVVMNLCTNAAQAMMNGGGVLDVKTSEAIIANGSGCEWPALSPGTYIELTVSDTGHGMERHVMERIFEPYFTTRPKGDGSGLGLPVVYRIVKECCGDIFVTSRPGMGTKFQVLFPKHEEEMHEEAVDAFIPTGNEVILQVDDEAQLSFALKSMLTHLGYCVISKAGSLEALESFRRRSKEIDLVITDLTMPEMTGDRLAMEIKRIRPDIPIILFTGYGEQLSKEKARQAGIREIVAKPVDRGTLAQLIRKILDKAA